MPSSCSSIDRLMTPYVDGELPDTDRRVVEQHLTACPPCRARAHAEHAVRDLLHERQPVLERDAAPAELRHRCAMIAAAQRASDAVARVVPLAGSGAAARPRLAGWQARLAPLATAAALVLLVGGAFLYQATARSAHVMAAELAADHMKCFAMNAVLGTHQSADAVQASMASGFGWSMALPTGADREDLELVGSRPCLYGEGKVAHIMYRHRGNPLSLFMLPRSDRSAETLEALGHECAIWSDNDRTYVLVSNEARSEVERLAAFVRAAWK